MDDTLARTIEHYFSSKSDVIAVYIFGSHASGKERSFSDVDIGLLLDDNNRDTAGERSREFLVDLSRLLRKDIHPVILNFAGEELTKQIFLKGKCILINKPEKLARYRMVMLSRIADFSYYREKMQTGLVRNIMEKQDRG